MVKDVTEADFMTEVVERSRETPVVVDFWAEWCGPCRQLGPALETAVGKRDGKVELAKVDVDSNQSLASAFGVQGIPAVKAFRDGKIVAEFTGAIPPAQIEQFLDALVPSEADELADAGDEESLRQAVAIDPRHPVAAPRLGKLLLERGEREEALALLEPLQGDFIAEGLVARAQLEDLDEAFSAWDQGDAQAALESLQEVFSSEQDPDRRDLIRRVMVAIFTELGPDHELAREHRRRLAAALN